MLTDFGRRAFNSIGNGFTACRIVFQILAQSHKGVDLAVFIHRNAQPAVLLRQAAACAGNEEIVFILFYRQHIIFIFDSLPCFVADAVNDRRADIGVFFSFLTDRANIVDGGFQVLLFFRRLAHVFDVHRSKLVEFQFIRGLAQIQRKLAHGSCFEFDRSTVGISQIPGFKRQVRAAVGKTCLINRNTVQRQRMVDADGVFADFAGRLVRDFQVAGEIARHTGIVKVDMEFLQFDGKRQVLHEHAVIRIQKYHVRALTFRNIDIAPKRQIGRTQHAFGLKVFGVNRRIVRHDLAGEHADFQQDIAVYQTAQTNHNQRGMGKDIAPFVHRAFFRRHQNRTVFTRNGFAAIALHFQITLRDFGRYLSV